VGFSDAQLVANMQPAAMGRMILKFIVVVDDAGFKIYKKKNSASYLRNSKGGRFILTTAVNKP